MSNYGIKKVFATPLDTIDTEDKEGVGVIRWEGNVCYKYVLFNAGAGTVAPIVGAAAYYYGASAAGTAGYGASEVTMDLTDAVSGAGIFMSILTDGDWGWIQIKGIATMTVGILAGADGNALTHIGASSDGGLDVSAAVTDQVCAYAFDHSADIIICDFPF
jgi:hypothetical protein